MIGVCHCLFLPLQCSVIPVPVSTTHSPAYVPNVSPGGTGLCSSGIGWDVQTASATEGGTAAAGISLFMEQDKSPSLR